MTMGNQTHFNQRVSIEPTLSEITDLIASRLADTGTRKLLIQGEEQLRYSSLLSRIPKVSALLDALKCSVGDRAIILSHSDSANITLFFGLIASGVTAVILNPDASTEELEHLIRAADAQVIFVDTTLLSKKLEASSATKLSTIVPIEPELKRRGVFKQKRAAQNEERFPAILDKYKRDSTQLTPVANETIAYILFTSGTTSQPKGVQISHRALFAQMSTFVRQYGLGPSSRLLNILPFHHTDGLTQGAVVSFVAGATLYRPMRFRVDRLPELIDSSYRDRISHFVCVPSLLTLIRQLGVEYFDAFAYEELQFIISTAAYLDESLWRDFEQKFNARIVNVYGLTETVCEACYCGPDAASFRYGTVGKPVDCEVALFDDNGAKLESHVGETGELAIRGDNVMSGYFRMPAETSRVMRGDWFLTGDLANIDEDGFIRIVGRKKSVIISGGYNIYPEDITRVIRGIHGVIDAVTFGMDDTIWGEKAVTCVVADSHSNLTPQLIAATFLDRASKEKLPREIYIVDSLPRGPSGKVIIEEARKLVIRLAERTSKYNHTADAVRSIAAQAFAISPTKITMSIGPDSADGWTSVAHVEFLLSLERHFGITMTPRDIMRIDSVQAALDVVEEHTT